jgi:acid phosphatase family membrane protein YuiD
MNLSQIYGTGYEALIIGISAVIIAQVLKFFVHLVWKRKIDLRLFTTTGGMPSSHSAGVIGLSATVGFICGFESIEFAMAFGYALVVMYDAAGVRRAAGKQAACLNKIIMDIYKQELKEAGGKLKELLGHTPMQVLVGAIFGVIYSYYMHNLFKVLAS